jgi:hypothetical protein
MQIAIITGTNHIGSTRSMTATTVDESANAVDTLRAEGFGLNMTESRMSMSAHATAYLLDSTEEY